MNERLTAIVGARITEFRRKMAEVKKMAKTVPNKIVVKVEARVNKFQSTISRIANTMRAFDEIARNTGQGLLMMVSPSIVPILASLIGVVGALGPMIGTLGGSTFALATAFGFAGVAAIAFGAAAVPALTKIFDGSELVTKSQKDARKAFEKFKSTWNDITKSVEKPVLQATAKAFTAFNKILEMSKPLFQSAAEAVNRLMASFNQSLNTAPVKAFFDYLNKQGGPMLEKVGKAAGNFLQGLMSMMTAFGPLAEKTAQGFLNMSNGFASWAAGLSKSEKFQSFVDYINENMPKIRAIFRDALAGIVYFFSAFGPLSADMMTGLQNMMSKFKEWASTLKNNAAFKDFISYIRDNAPKVITLIGNLSNFLVNMGVALAPMGSSILDIANKFINWTNTMMQTHPIIGKIIAVLVVVSGALLALVPNIIAIMTLFDGMGVKLMGIVSKVGPKLLPFLTKLGTSIVRLGTLFFTNAARIAASWLIAMGPIGWITIAVVALVALIIANWDTVKAWTIAAWTATVNFLVAAWDLIKSYAVAKFNGLVSFFTTVWNLVKVAASAAWNFITTYLMQKWNSIRTTATAIFNAVRSFLLSVWSSIKSGISSVVSAIVSFITNNWNRFKSTTTSIYNAVKSFIVNAWNSIKSTTSSVVANILSTVKSKFEALKNAVSEKMTAAKQKIVDIWNQAKSFLEGINLYSIGVNIIQGLINGIGSMAGAVASKISDIAGGIKDKITGALGIHSPSRYMKWIGEMTGTGLVKGINSMITPVTDIANRMAKAAMIEPQRTQFNFDSDNQGFSESRKSVRMKQMPNEKETNESKGNMVIQLMMDSDVLGTAVMPHIEDSQDRQLKVRMATMGLL